MNATPAPLHDIAPPVPFFPYPMWLVFLVVFSLLAIFVLLAWIAKLVFSKKRKTLPPERALAALASLRTRMGTISPYEFGVEISTILRHYIKEEYGLSAPTQTSLEFLVSIRNNVVFNVQEKAMLGEFLQAADLLKFARAKVGADESTSLLQQAEKLVGTRNKAPDTV